MYCVIIIIIIMLQKYRHVNSSCVWKCGGSWCSEVVARWVCEVHAGDDEASVMTGSRDLSPLSPDLLIQLCSHRAWWHTRPLGQLGTQWHTHACPHTLVNQSHTRTHTRIYSLSLSLKQTHHPPTHTHTDSQFRWLKMVPHQPCVFEVLCVFLGFFPLSRQHNFAFHL